MFSKRVLFAMALVFSLLITVDAATAQIVRRAIRRMTEIPVGGPGYQVAPQSPTPRTPFRQPLIQGDGRFLERARNIINLFTESGTELKPVAVISFASFEEYNRVVRIVAEQIRLNRGSAEEPALLNAFLNVYERIVAQGFDTRQPLGMILQTDGLLFYPLIFTPMNLDGQAGQNMLRRYAERLPDGRYALRQDAFAWPLGRLFIRQHNGWLFLATEVQLNALPDDPTVLLQGLDREYLAAARFDLQNVPALSTRAALNMGEANAIRQAETELERAGARLWIGYLRSLAEQSDFLEYTLSYDEESNDYVIRQREIVKPNTERARLLQARREATSPFHGFYRPEGAMFASHFVMHLTRSQQEHLETILDEAIGRHLLTEEERLEWKKTAEAEPSRRQRRAERLRNRAANTIAESGGAPTLAPVSEPTTEEERTTDLVDVSQDPRDRLARLLAQTSPPADESVAPPEKGDDVFGPPEPMPEFVLGATPEGELSEAEKLEIVLRRIGACYYWALVGAVRNGSFDGASTCSMDSGLLGAYKIAEGDRFLKAFDTIFAEIAERFPDLYASAIRKDYAETEGFRLTSITFRLAELIRRSKWSRWIPERFGQREITIVLGVRNDAVCYAVGQGALPETRLMEAIAGMETPLPVHDLFFVFSAHELGRAFAQTEGPDRLIPLKIVAANSDPNARAYARTEFTDTTKTITLRISGLLTPSIWRLRDNLREARSYR